MRKRNASISLTVRLPKDVHDELVRVAKLTDKSVAHIATWWLRLGRAVIHPGRFDREYEQTMFGVLKSKATVYAESARMIREANAAAASILKSATAKK